MHHRPCDGKTLHHATGKAANHLVGAIPQLETIEQCFGALGAFWHVQAEIGAMEGQNLKSRQGKIKVWALGNDPDQSFDSDLLFPDVMAADPGLAAGRPNPCGEDSN